MENKIQMRKERNAKKDSKFVQFREAVRAVMPSKDTVQFWSAGPSIFVKELEAILERFTEKDDAGT